MVETGINQYPQNDPLTKKAILISAPSFPQCWPSRCSGFTFHIPLTAYDFVIFVPHMLAGYLGLTDFSSNDEFAHTYPLVDRSTLEEWRSGRWCCRNCCYMQVVSGNR